MRYARIAIIAAALALVAPFTVGVGSASGVPAPATGQVAVTAHTTPTLVGIRAAHHPGYDRIVFEFAGGLPTSRSVTYVDRLLGDGSAMALPIAGRAILQVRFYPAQAHNDSHATAPATESFATPAIVQYVRSGDFEGVTTYGIGLARKQPVKVFTLTKPTRVVIDISTRFPTTTRKVWLFNAKNFTTGKSPYYTPVWRPLRASAPATAAMDRIFAGPTAGERAAGLQRLTSGATGFRNLSISKGVARVHLTGVCDSRGSTATIAGEIMPTLKQFPTVKWVKIYDHRGHTERPTGYSDSVPECLEP